MNYQVTGNEYLSPAHHPGNRRRGGGRYLPVHAAQGPFGDPRGCRADPPLRAGGRNAPSASSRMAACPLLDSRLYVRGKRPPFLLHLPYPHRGAGAVLRLSVTNIGPQVRAVRFGTEGEWAQTLHEINETAPLTTGREAVSSGWNHMFLFSQKPGSRCLPLPLWWPIRSRFRRLTSRRSDVGRLCLPFSGRSCSSGEKPCWIFPGVGL